MRIDARYAITLTYICPLLSLPPLGCLAQSEECFVPPIADGTCVSRSWLMGSCNRYEGKVWGSTKHMSLLNGWPDLGQTSELGGKLHVSIQVRWEAFYHEEVRDRGEKWKLFPHVLPGAWYEDRMKIYLCSSFGCSSNNMWGRAYRRGSKGLGGYQK